MGVDNGALWLEYPGTALPKRYYPGISPGRGLHDLMLSFSPDKDGVAVRWSFDAQARKQTPIPAFSASFDQLVVGGDSSAAGVWDALGLCYDDVGGPPPFLAASLFRIHGESIKAASGFESGLGGDFIAYGKVVATPFSVLMDAGSGIGFRGDLATDKGLTIVVSARSGSFSLDLNLPDGSPFLVIGSDGSVRDASGLLLASLREEPKLFSMTLSKGDRTIEIRGPGGSAQVIRLDLPPRLKPSLTSASSADLASYWIATNTDT